LPNAGSFRSVRKRHDRVFTPDSTLVRLTECHGRKQEKLKEWQEFEEFWGGRFANNKGMWDANGTGGLAIVTPERSTNFIGGGLAAWLSG
jgi:hypothetical protein